MAQQRPMPPMGGPGGRRGPAGHGFSKPKDTKKTLRRLLQYLRKDIPLVAVDDLEELGKKDPLYRALGEIVKKNGGSWCVEAENYLLANAPRI